MTKVIYCMVMCLSWLILPGQSIVQIGGKIIDTSGGAMVQATVILLSDPDTLTKLTDQDGRFAFNTSPKNRQRLIITMKGYQKREIDLNLEQGRHFYDVGKIVLKVNYQELDPITISHIRPISISGDTTNYAASAFPVRIGASVQDILRQLPGIEVDASGNVTAKGKKVEKVLVNGREYFGKDVLIAIQTLPADLVGRLQLIDDYGNKARLTGIKLGDADKTLNIVLSPTSNSRKFGQARFGDGDDGRYVGNTIGNIFKGNSQLSGTIISSSLSNTGRTTSHAIDLSYANSWKKGWSMESTGDVTLSDKQNNGSVTTNSFFPGKTIHIAETTNLNIMNRKEGLSATFAEQKQHSLLRLSPNLDINNSQQETNGKTSVIEQDSSLSNSSVQDINSKSTKYAITGGSSLYYERTYAESRRRFSIDASLSSTKIHQRSDNTTSTRSISDSTIGTNVTHYLIHNTDNNLVATGSSTYFAPVGKVSFFELGYRLKSENAENMLVTKSPEPAANQFKTVDSLSRSFRVHSFAHSVHTGFTSRISQFSFEGLVDVGPGSLSGESPITKSGFTYLYLNLVSSFRGNFLLSKLSSLTFSYKSTPLLPAFQQIAPGTDANNPQYPITGNPNLKTAITQNAAIHYELNAQHAASYWGGGGGIGFGRIDRPIISSISYANDSSPAIQRTTYVNGPAANSIRGDYYVTFPSILKKHLRMSLNGQYQRNQTATFLDKKPLLNTAINWNQAIHVQYQIPNSLDADLSANYATTKTYFTDNAQTPTSTTMAAINIDIKAYLKKKWCWSFYIVQTYNGINSNVITQPTFLTISIDRTLFQSNRGSINLNCNNVLNAGSQVAQSSVLSNVTQYQTTFSKRYFLLSFRFRFESLKK